MVAGAADVGVEGRGGEGEDAGEEVARPAVAAGRGCRVRPIGADHVVDGGHVDAVVGDADDGAEDQAADPVDRRALRGPSEADQPDGQAWGGEEEPPEARLVLRAFVVRFGVPLFDVAPDGRDEGEPGDDVADADGDEGQAERDGREVPLLVDKAEGLEEHEDEGVAEAGEEGERQHNGLGQEHFEGPDPGDEDFSGGEAILEGHELVRAPEVDGRTVLFALLASSLSDLIHHAGRPRLGDDEEVEELHGTSEDELDPDAPAPAEICLDETANDGAED